MQFRKDINGLRALAVIAVVLFHFNASWMPGGFSGVDVFFVISGFLMTRIIFRGIEQENFSILRFYIARAKRIIPALAMLCLVLFVFGYFQLSGYNFDTLNKHILSSISFTSNIIYNNESGYFDAAASKKWLLHTWSLSVEWQFYIIYPLALVVLRKFISVRAIKTTVLFGTILGFIFCVIASYKWPNSAYYLLPTRVWEMTIGGVAYLYPLVVQEKRKIILERVGLLLIVGSYFFISKENHWPGYLALFPVLGSFLIIQAQRNDSFITSNIVSQKIGTWSYSIYLWHWPIVVASYYYKLGNWMYLGIVVSILLGWVSFNYIEKNPKKIINIIAYFIVAIFSLCVTYNAWDKQKEETLTRKYADSKYATSKHCLGIEKHCKAYGDLTNLDFILWGDSHAQTLQKALAINGYNFIAFSTPGCPPIYGVRRADTGGTARNCNAKLNDDVYYRIQNIQRVNHLLLIGKWSMYAHGLIKNKKLQKASHFLCFTDCKNATSGTSFKNWKVGLSNTIEKLKNNFNIIIFKGGPILKERGVDYNSFTSKNLYFNEHLKHQEITDAYIDDIALEKNLRTIDHGKYFFENDTLMIKDKNGKYFFKDDNHVTLYGWNYILKNLKIKLDNALNK